VLRGFSERVRQILRPPDLLSRWGGDEFVALVPCSSPISPERFEQIKAQARGIHKVASMGKEIQVDVSATLSIVYHQPGETAEALLARADIQLYKLKQVR
jgi:diguanylate cyclase (GGDEF)-like protein